MRSELDVDALLEAGRLLSLSIDGTVQYGSAALDRRWQEQMLELLGGYHKKYPLRRGMPVAELRQRVFEKLSVKQLSALLERYADEGLIVLLSGSLAARADFPNTPTARQRADLEALEQAFLDNKFMPPDWDEVVSALHIAPVWAAEYLNWLLENGRLTRVGDLMFSSQAVQEAEALLRANFTTFTMAQARDLLGSTRKYMQTLLEFFDARRRTVREGDFRRFLG